MPAETTAQKIARLEKLLSAGVTSTRSADVAATFDLDAIRQQLRALRHEDLVTRARRPVCAQIRLT